MIWDILQEFIDYNVSDFKTRQAPADIKASQEEVTPGTIINNVTKIVEAGAAEDTGYMKFSDDAFIIFNDSLQIYDFSENFERIVGIKSQSLLKKGFISVVYEEMAGGIYANMQELLQKGRHAEEREFSVKFSGARNKGKIFSAKFIKIDDESGKALICKIKNITKDSESQRQYKISQGKAEAALRSRSEFLANMSHELRTPLNAIMGFSQMIRDGIHGDLDNKKYNEYMDYIHSSGSELLSKISDLLEMANFQAGLQRIDEEEFNLAMLISHSIEIHSHTAFVKNIIIKNEINPKLWLKTDRLKIFQMISNLILDSINNSKEATVIKILAEEQAGKLALSISNEDFEIDTNKAKQVNQNLQNKDYDLEFGDDVLGLSLSIVREFAHLLGVKLQYDVCENNGYQIKVIMPKKYIVQTQKKVPLKLCVNN